MIRAPRACLSRCIFATRQCLSAKHQRDRGAGRSQLHGGYRARERTGRVSVSCSGGHLGRYVGRQRGRHLIDSAKWAYPELHPQQAAWRNRDRTRSVTMSVSAKILGGYAVTVLAADQVLSATEAGNPDSIPIAALQVRESAVGDNGSFSSVSDARSVSVHTQGARSADGGDALSNGYRVTIPFVAKDTYAVTLNYIATTL